MAKQRKACRLPRGAWLLGFGLAAAILGLCGCTTVSEYIHNGFKVGPNYKRPPAPLPDAWIDATDPKVRHGDPNLCSWWDVFDDPILTKLIHDSYANNFTIKAAGFAILQAKEMRCIAIGELFPQSQSYQFGYTRNMSSETGGAAVIPSATFGTALSPPQGLSPVAAPATPIAGVVDPGSGTTTSPSAGTSGTASPSALGGSSRYFSNVAMAMNASWELDFWGLFRRNVEAANAVLDQSVFNYDEMVVLLLANVASQYVEIRTLQRRLELAKKNVAMQIPLVDIYRKREKAGIINALPGYLQLLANLENTKALIPQLEILLREANNELCVLLGLPVHDLLPVLGDGTVPEQGQEGKEGKRRVRIPRPVDYAVVVGIPGDFLLRRPDMLSAEAQLRFQSAQIGIAEAEMLPHMGFNGTIGLASAHIADLFQGKSWTGSIGPSLSWNILNYGRLLANVHFQDFLFLQYLNTYLQAILNANQDAENAMVAYLRSIDQAGHLQESADAAAGATAYLDRQLIQGYVPSIPATGADVTGAFVNQLFTLINFQVTQQDAAAQAEGNIALNLILLYRAMGGGWQIRLEDGKYCGNTVADANLPPWAWQNPARQPGNGTDEGNHVPPAAPKQPQPAPETAPEQIRSPPKLLVPEKKPPEDETGAAAPVGELLPPLIPTSVPGPTLPPELP